MPSFTQCKMRKSGKEKGALAMHIRTMQMQIQNNSEDQLSLYAFQLFAGNTMMHCKNFPRKSNDNTPKIKNKKRCSLIAYQSGKQTCTDHTSRNVPFNN